MQKFCFSATWSPCLLLYLVCLCVYKQTFSTPEMTCKSCHTAFDAWDEELGQEWHVPHWNEGHVTHDFLSVSGWVTLPLPAMGHVSMAVAPVPCSTSVCSWLLRWASPHSIPASCPLCCFKVLWDMRLAGIRDTSWALLIWLCWAEPLAFPGIPLHSCPGSAVGWAGSQAGCFQNVRMCFPKQSCFPDVSRCGISHGAEMGLVKNKQEFAPNFGSVIIWGV